MDMIKPTGLNKVEQEAIAQQMREKGNAMLPEAKRLMSTRVCLHPLCHKLYSTLDRSSAQYCSHICRNRAAIARRERRDALNEGFEKWCEGEREKR